MNFRYDINSLRALAVLLIVFYHYEVSGFEGGFIGVDIFFVISGYLMTEIISRTPRSENFSFIAFYAARARRIVPALALMISVVVGVGWLLLNPSDYARTARAGGSAILFISNTLFWRTTDYFNHNGAELLLHTWSLSVEWQFYLIYPLFVRTLMRATRSNGGLCGSLWMMGICSFALASFVSTRDPNFGFYWLPTRAWEMIAGGLAFLYAREFPKTQPTRVILGLSIAALIGCTISYSSVMGWPSGWTVVPVISVVMILVIQPKSAFMRFQPIQALGRMSYSIYLWHWPILLVLERMPLHVLGYGYRATALLVTLLASALSFRLVEPGRVARRPAQFGSIGVAGSCVLLFACVLIWRMDGVLARGAASPDAYKRTLTAQFDWEYPEACGYKASKKHLVLCEVGSRSATNKLLFIGDSHAEQYYARFAELTKTRDDFHVTFATYGGCPPFSGTNRIGNAFNCPAFFTKVAEIAKSTPWERVILHGFWPAYFPIPEGESIQPMLCISRKSGCDGSPLILSGNYYFLRDSLVEMINAVGSNAREVIVVLTSPHSQENIFQLKLDSEFFGRPFPLEAGIDLDYVERRSASVNALLRDAAAQTRALVLDPTDYLCPGGRCPVVDQDGKLLYRDGNHYRASFVRLGVHFLDHLVFTRARASTYGYE